MQNRIDNLQGTFVIGESGKRYRLSQKIGSGAQGVVYEDDSGNFVVKLYHTEFASSHVMEQLHFVKKVKLPPNFVPVEDLLCEPHVGFVMKRVIGHEPLDAYLIPDPKLPFHKWYNKEKGFLCRLFLGRMIATAFEKLESENLSYCDISGKNILVRTKNKASVQMIDVDNIYVAGRGNPGVLGTPRYIAPEVVKGLNTPDIFSDNYSLAVILYELLRVGHPYISDEIANGSPEDEAKALAGECDYISPENSTHLLPEDVVFTTRLKNLFSRCFKDGKFNRLKRPSAKEFEFALIEASNNIIKCPHCGAWHYPRKTGKKWNPCPWCDGESSPKARIQFYDFFFEGTDYQKAYCDFEKKSQPKATKKTATNSYVIKDDFKNRVPRFYVVGEKSYTMGASVAENCFSIYSKNGTCTLVNDGLDMPIKIKHYGSTNFTIVKKDTPCDLKNGDTLFFEIGDDSPATIVEASNQQFGLIKMAMFMEV